MNPPIKLKPFMYTKRYNYILNCYYEQIIQRLFTIIKKFSGFIPCYFTYHITKTANGFNLWY